MKSNEATKLAAPASAPSDRKMQDPDEDTSMPVPPPKAALLPTGLSRALVISSVLLMITACVVGLLGDRYSLVAVPNSPNAMAYRLDRLTGGVAFCSATQCSPVSFKAD